MKRLIFCPGICQVVNASAALVQHHSSAPQAAAREDILVLFGRGRDTAYGRVMQEIAESIKAWRKICWAEHVIVGHFPARRFAPIARDLLQMQLGKADEIWVCKLAMGFTSAILYAFPEAEVVLYEDGAEEFIPQELTCGRDRWRTLKPSRWLGGIKREASHWNKRPECMELDGVCTRELARVNRFYSFLGQYLDVPDYLGAIPRIWLRREVLTDCFRSVAERFATERCAQPPCCDNDRVALFLPQPFATYFLTPEDEFTLYYRALLCLRDQGYTVLWKEHPQEVTPLAGQLQERLGDDTLQVLKIRQLLPIECLVADWRLDAVIAVSSTSLLYLHGIYRYPAYTAAGMISPDAWLQRSDLELAKLFRRHVPELPQAAEYQGVHVE